MIAALAKTIFGSANDRYVRSLGKYVDATNAFEPTISALTDDELRNQTQVFRQRLADGTKLDDLLPEAFATVREAAKRTSAATRAVSAKSARWATAGWKRTVMAPLFSMPALRTSRGWTVGPDPPCRCRG